MKRFSTILKNDQIDSLAIGGFDGLHLAHQKLISHLTDTGALIVIDKKTASLTPKGHRCSYLKQECIFLSFDEIRDLSAESFIAFLKNKFINLKKIVVGYDFRFGKCAHANAQDLKRLFEGNVVIVEEVFFEGVSVHSRIIRDFLRVGKIKEANRLLGRNYEIIGSVIKGQGIGAKKLFPTLNLKVEDFLIPKEGVYATITKIANKSYPSASFIGKRLSTDGNFSIETHLLDEELEVVNGEVSIIFIEHIRDNRKFDNLELLKKQISEDFERARIIHALL
ncbi:MAG TPA: bifunctional riboflavin kinase/FAD synthetase [Campylobacterales bacterium]|nr:bifunctional riboflavin kinase/FAD synthetase [Campylobacterales bacterium]